MILAKAVIPNQYWILKHNDRKIGNIEADRDGFSVKINNKIERFENIKTIKQKVAIDFEPSTVAKKPKKDNSVHGYHTVSKPYNAIYDVKLHIPLWTKEPKSKSWYAAGWYLVKQGRVWELVECPKLITLQRYDFKGPFHSKEQAQP